MNCKNTIRLVLTVVFLFSYCRLYANENIDPNNDGSQYAYGENIGWINFEPNVSGPNVGAMVTAESITGFIWAENVGWINSGPNVPNDSNYYGITNDGSGKLSGYACGENIGWINFDTNVPNDSNDYGVTIDYNGNFGGWAWGENIGWINFNSADLYGYNVRAGINYCTTCGGDLDANSVVNLDDLNQLIGDLTMAKISDANEWLILKGDPNTGIYWRNCSDMDVDCDIDLADLNRLIGNLTWEKITVGNWYYPCGTYDP